MTINHISSIPIGVYQNTIFDEHSYFYNLDYHDEDKFFSRSVNTYVLDNTKLKEWIQEKINDYTKSAFATLEKLKITQSWCIRHCYRNSEVYSHTHPNSILSGAYYVECNEKSSSLSFKSPSILVNNQLDWVKNDSLLRSQSWLWKIYEVPINKGLLILFPSNLEHFVKKSIDKDNRCVLSFNTWFEKEMGEIEKLNFLKI